MSKNLLKIILIILFQLTFTGCQNTTQKANQFVNSYNASSGSITNSVITSTSAKLGENNTIEIRFDSNIPYDAEDKTYSKIFPNMMASMFTSYDETQDLIEEGVVFNVGFYADNGKKINSIKVDKAKLEEMLKTRPSAIKDASATASNVNLPTELKETLVIMNQSLPIENNDGTKIIKIDFSDAHELVYTVEVPDAFSESLKGEDAKNIMKEEIMRNSNLPSIMANLRTYGITKIKYIYQDSKGKEINEIIMSSADLK